ncbi:MAG: hypothetical protein KF764_14615 [Labilithrix sp.]|nr:hypothetical protein [Labilithrix sp.]
MSAPLTPEPASRQAPDAVDRRAIARVTVASIVVMSGALVTAWVLLASWREEPVGPRAAPTAAPEEIGMLEQTPILDTRRGLDLRLRQEADLHRFAWVDRDAGVAQIPIDEAIDLLVARPLPPDRPLAPRRPDDARGSEEAH